MGRPLPPRTSPCARPRLGVGALAPRESVDGQRPRLGVLPAASSACPGELLADGRSECGAASLEGRRARRARRPQRSARRPSRLVAHPREEQRMLADGRTAGTPQIDWDVGET